MQDTTPQNQSVVIDGNQQVTINESKNLRIHWKLQYGINQQLTDQTKNASPIVVNIDNDAVALKDGNGVCWVDPGGDYFIGAQRIVKGGDDPQLRGWFNGDNYYFQSLHNLNADFSQEVKENPPPNRSSQGSFNNNTSTNAVWKEDFTLGNATLRNGVQTKFSGYQITNIQRPVKVQWNYDELAIDRTVTIGDFVFEKDNDTETLEKFVSEPTSIIKKPGSDIDGLSAPRCFEWDPINKKLYPLWADRTGKIDTDFEITWEDVNGLTYLVTVTVKWPNKPHYPHVVNAPGVNLDPNPDDDFKFRELRHSTSEAVVDTNNWFTAKKKEELFCCFPIYQQMVEVLPRSL